MSNDETTVREGEGVVHGEFVEPCHIRLEHSENDDAWIDVEYKDGWVGRKLLNTDQDVYDSMVHPFYFKCAFCREWGDTMRWGLESEHCPHCEQWHEFLLPRLMDWLVDGESLKREEAEI